jgi:hypothetical protein
MDVNAESIRGTTRTPLDRQAWGDSTVKGNTLYLHVFHWPKDGRLVVGGLQTDVSNAYLLMDAKKGTLQTSRVNANDVLVHVPPTAPDATDTVVVLQLAGDLKAVKGRLLATNIDANQLLAFDATPHGKFTYGDGKAGKYYAAGFKSADNYLAWPIRTNDAATYEVSVHYNSPKGGKIQVKAGDQTLSGEMEAGGKGIQTVKIGELKLDATETELRVKPAAPDAEVQVFDVVLTPVK